jgi:membrane-associated protease RseP (regulator of RpoE activity)
MSRVEPDEQQTRSAAGGAYPSLSTGEPVRPLLDPAQAQPPDETESDDDEPVRSWFSEFGLPIGLFVLTVFTTLWAGAYQTKTTLFQSPWKFLTDDPSVLWKGIPFSATLLAILVTHEFGHYLLSRIHRAPASLPLFIPGFPQLVGTFGAIIRMRGPISNRKALFDIGVAGPLAGFIVAVIALAVGLQWSEVVLDSGITDTFRLGPSLLLDGFIWLFVGSVPYGHVIDLHPIAAAAWFGLFITSLNLIPIGQLDGGHVAYALWGERQKTVAFALLPLLIFLGFTGWPGWFVWIAMAGLFGFGHPPIMDPEAMLGRRRIWLGRFTVVIFVLTFSPIPITVR